MDKKHNSDKKNNNIEDGKEIHSMRKIKKPLNIVSAQIAEYGLTIAQNAVPNKKKKFPQCKNFSAN